MQPQTSHKIKLEQTKKLPTTKQQATPPKTKNKTKTKTKTKTKQTNTKQHTQKQIPKQSTMKFSAASIATLAFAASHMLKGASANSERKLRGENPSSPFNRHLEEDCVDDPNWHDSDSTEYTCEYYKDNDICDPANWPADWGTPEDWKNFGKTHLEACCESCGDVLIPGPTPGATPESVAFTGENSDGPCNFFDDRREYCDYQSYYSQKTENYCQFENLVWEQEDGSFRQSTGFLKCCNADYYINGQYFANIICPAFMPDPATDTCEEATGSACTAYTKELASCAYGDVKCYCDGGQWVCN